MIGRRGRWRTRLLVDNRRHVAVLISRAMRPWKETIRWQVDPVPRESRLVTLLARLDPENKAFQDFHVFPTIDRSKRFTIGLCDEWLEQGDCLNHLSDFCSTVKMVCGSSAGQDG